MLGHLKSFISKIYTRLNFFFAARSLAFAGYTDITPDIEDKSILFSFDQCRAAILNMDHDMLGYSIEATVVFASEVLSLKTMSDISNLTFMYRCSCSGVRPASDGRVRLNLSYHIGRSVNTAGIRIGMLYVTKCLATLELYLTERLQRTDKESYDLSMFEDIDLVGFSPQIMGECKEFIYGSWDAYVEVVKRDFASFTNHPYAADLLAKIESCRRFEEINNVPLSEIGIALLDDITLNRQLREISKTSYGVN